MTYKVIGRTYSSRKEAENVLKRYLSRFPAAVIDSKNNIFFISFGSYPDKSSADRLLIELRDVWNFKAVGVLACQ